MYGNGYLNETQPDNDLIEEDLPPDQSSQSFSQDSTRYESQEYVDEMTDDGI